MLHKLMIDVVVGDVIMDGSSRTTVTKVEQSPNSCKNKTHINEKDCWESFTEVRIQDNGRTEY